MSHLFAFNNAEDMVVHNVPAGHYDAEQQLWVADDVSRASVTARVTTSATMSGGNVDVALDVEID